MVRLASPCLFFPPCRKAAAQLPSSLAMMGQCNIGNSTDILQSDRYSSAKHHNISWSRQYRQSIRVLIKPGFPVPGNIEDTHKAGKDPEAQRSSVDILRKNSACDIVLCAGRQRPPCNWASGSPNTDRFVMWRGRH